MTGLGLFLQKKNDGAKTFYGMNSYNSHKIYRKNTSAGLLFRIIKWGAKTFFGERNDGALTFSGNENDGAATFFGEKNDGAKTFLGA